MLDPFSVYRKGEALLRRQLSALAGWHLVNIIRRYELSDEDPAVLGSREPAELVELIKGITGWETSLWELMKVGERAINMARANGLSMRAFQEKLNQMAINNEITYGLGLGSMMRGKKQPSGLFVPDSLLAHANKVHVATLPYETKRLAQEIVTEQQTEMELMQLWLKKK